MKVIICQRTGLQFEAPTSRYKQHPNISSWLQKANREGWYKACNEAIASLHEAKTDSIEEYNRELKIVQEIARKNALEAITQNDAYWKAVKQATKERKRQNLALRQAGYRWVNVAYEVDDPDQAQWELLAPDGQGVSMEEALKTINYY